MTIPSKFEVDCKFELCSLIGIDVLALQPLLEWIKAPPNLQQFRPVVRNLISLFRCGEGCKITEELGLDLVPWRQWLSFLENIEAVLPSKLPRELAHLEANGTTRPDGLIGSYPIYASLTADGVLHTVGETRRFQRAHLIGLCCAIGYQWQIDTGEITKPTGGIDDGMRDIRDLEKYSKRPSQPIPDFYMYPDLEALWDGVGSWVKDHREDGKKTWGQGLRLLISSYTDSREGYQRRYHLGISRQVRRIIQEDFEEDASAGTSPIHITRYLSYPDAGGESTLKSLGLNPGEMQVEKFIAIDDPAAPSEAKRDERISRLRQRGRLQGVIRNAQELPDDWGTPTAYEIMSLVAAVNGGELSGDEVELPCGVSELNALINLRIWTGLSIEHLQTLRYFENKKAYLARKDIYLGWLRKEAVLALPVRTPARRLRRDDIDRVLLTLPELGGRHVETEAVVYVRLPANATEAVQQFADRWRLSRSRSNESTLFRNINAGHHAAIRQCLQLINGRYTTRWTEQRLSLIIRNAILQCGGDQVFVHLLTRQEIGHAAVAAHYQCTDLPLLEHLMHQAHAHVRNMVQGSTNKKEGVTETPENASRVGSSLAVSDQFVHELGEHLKHQLRGCRRQVPCEEAWIATHNAFVAYIVHWFGFCSGHRAVCDPLHDPRLLDKQSGLIVISDKDDDDFRHSRIVCLPRLFIEQLDRYVEHLHTLANKLTRKPQLQTDIRKLCHAYLHPGEHSGSTELALPFLFFLSDKLRVKVVSPSTLRTLNPTSLPANIDRHFLRSQLSAYGAPPECIDYFMGHWAHGEEPYIKHSMISPMKIASVLQEYLDQVHKACGWTPQVGLQGG